MQRTGGDYPEEFQGLAVPLENNEILMLLSLNGVVSEQKAGEGCAE